MSATQREVEKAYASCVRRGLPFFQWLVLRFLNRTFLRFPTEPVLSLYREHLSDNHLEVGMRSASFLELSLPEGKPRVGLLDDDRDSLDLVAKRISAYRPEVFQDNVLEPLDLDVPAFESIAVNDLFHFLPGRLETKTALVFDHVAPYLSDDGTVFGASVLGKDVQMDFAARSLMGYLNKKEIFSNRNDALGAMMDALSKRFRTFNVEVHGCVVLFWGKGIRESYRERIAG